MIVACVRAGDNYGIDAVRRLRNGVSRHLQRPYTFACFTDRPERCEATAFLDIGGLDLDEDASRMLVFEPKWRGLEPVLYLALDTVIVGDLAPLTRVPGEFATYGSRVMLIGGGKAGFIWTRFERNGELAPTTSALRPLLPKGFLRAYPEVTALKPQGVALVVGVPESTAIPWLQQA